MITFEILDAAGKVTLLGQALGLTLIIAGVVAVCRLLSSPRPAVE